MIWALNILKNILNKTSPRKPPIKYDLITIRKILWVSEYRDKKNPDIDFVFKDVDEKLLTDAISPVIDYVNHRYDCSDFRVLALIKLKYVGQDLLDKYPEVNNKITQCLLGFKFWVTSPGNDSMCYYSENHIMVYITCEYLIGKLFPNEIFTIDNKNGLDHQKIALERFNYWIELRRKYCYSEFYSSNYLPISMTALAVMYQYCDDKKIKEKCKKEVDTLYRHIATTAFDGTFINASGRDYSRNVMNCSYKEPHSRVIMNLIFGDGKFAFYNYRSITSMFVSCYLNNKEFQIKEDVKKLYDEEETITKRKFSLNLSSYKDEGLLNNETKSLIMRLGSGALTNPEIINLTIKLLKDNKHFYHNNFLSWMRCYYSSFLYKLGVMGKLSKKMNFYNNRMAIEESNVYTYRNKYFKLSTNQGYKMNSLGAQKNTMVATLPDGITVFTMHPMVENNIPNFDYNSTPSYFSCYNFAPFAAQDKNVGLLIYNIPKRGKAYFYNNKLFGCLYRTIRYTHTFFPTELFDEYEVEGKYAFARVKDSYIALIGRYELFLKKNSEYVMTTTQGMLKDINKSFDLVQRGLNTYWIYELSSKADETFEQFKTRIKSNKISFNVLSLEYYSKNRYIIEESKELYVNGSLVNIKYNYDL